MKHMFVKIMHFVIPLFFVICILFSCKKDERDVKLTGTYKPAAQFIINGPPVMYTKTGKVNDQAIVNDLINRFRSISRFDSLNTIESPATTLEFLSNGLVKVTTNELIGTHSRHAFISEQTDDHLVITELDSILNNITYYDTCNEMIRMITGINKVTNCIPLGTSQFCKARPVFTLKLENGRVYQYMITSMVKNTFPGITPPGAPPAPDSYCMKSLYHCWDNFDPSIISSLGNRDTIIIQSKKVELIKQ